MWHACCATQGMTKTRRRVHTAPADPGSAATAQMARDTSAGVLDRERLAARAYELYLARGGGDGQAVEDWLAAERELRQGGSAATLGS